MSSKRRLIWRILPNWLRFRSGHSHSWRWWKNHAVLEVLHERTSGVCVKSRLRRNEIYWFLDGCSEARRGKGGCMQDWKTTPGIWPPNEPTRRLGSEWGSWALRCTKETSLPMVILMIAPQIKSSDGNFNEMLLRLDFTRKTLSLSKKFMWLFLNVLFLHFAVEINHSCKQFFGFSWPPSRLFKMVSHQLSHGLLWMEERLEAREVESSLSKFAKMVETSKETTE